MRAIVKIVYDPVKRKLRAKPVEYDGWVRFPNDLRSEEGLYYEVENLKSGKSGSWIASGDITRVSEEYVLRVLAPKTKGKKVAKTTKKKTKRKDTTIPEDYFDVKRKYNFG